VTLHAPRHAFLVVVNLFIRCIQAVFLVGRFNVTNLHTTIGSPFNVATLLPAPLWTKPEVEALFNDYAKERSVNLAPELINEIHRLTNGACFLPARA
jgi:hypothetical protein